jgi:hypothetical protein
LIIVYTPRGGEPEHYDARLLVVSEASIVARTVGMKWGDVKAGLQDEDLDAMRGVVWVLKKRTNPSLRFGDFDPGVEDMVTRLDEDEVRGWISRALAVKASDPEVTDTDFDQAMTRMLDAAADRERAKAILAEMVEEAEGKEADPAPLAEAASSSPTPTSTEPDSSTSASSPTSSTSPQLVSTS